MSAATQPGGVFVRPGAGPACRGCGVRPGEGWARARGACGPGGGGSRRGKGPSWLGVLPRASSRHSSLRSFRCPPPVLSRRPLMTWLPSVQKRCSRIPFSSSVSASGGRPRVPFSLRGSRCQACPVCFRLRVDRRGLKSPRGGAARAAESTEVPVSGTNKVSPVTASLRFSYPEVCFIPSNP